MLNTTQENVGKASTAVKKPSSHSIKASSTLQQLSALTHEINPAPGRPSPAPAPNTHSSFLGLFQRARAPPPRNTLRGQRDRHPLPASDRNRRKTAVNQRISPSLPHLGVPGAQPCPDRSNVAAPAPPPGRHRLPGAPRGFRAAAAAAGPRLPGTGRGGWRWWVCVGICGRLQPRVSSVSLGAGAAIGPGEEGDWLGAPGSGAARAQRGQRGGRLSSAQGQ